MIKKFSIVAITTLVFIGCGGSGGKTGTTSFVTKNTNAVTINDLKSLGDSIDTKTSSRSLQSAAKTYTNDDSSSAASQGNPCESGSMKFTGDENSPLFSVDAHQCKNGSSSIDGAVDVKISKQAKSGSIEITRDITLTDDTESIFLAKGSKISAQNNLITADFKAKINGEVLSAKNVAIAYTEQNYGATITLQSGQVNIADYYFEFVSQPKPFVIDDNGLLSGELNLKDGAGHKIQVMVDENQQLVLKVDENGDGTFSANEILKDENPSNTFIQ